MMLTRRALMLAGAAFGGTTVATVAAADGDTLQSEFLFDLELTTGTPTAVGFPGGERSIVGVTGGSFAGPRLKGTVVGAGGDWIVRRPDGSSVLDVRLIVTTDDGERIFVTWRGVAYAGESGLVARIVPMFETSSAKYAWLNTVVSVGVYRPAAGKVAYRVYRIL